MPGPGAYSSMPGITPKAVPENLQAFGSTQKRLASDAITPNERQRMAQPGPGAYEERRTDFKGGMGASAFAQHMAAQGVDAGAQGRSGFNSSTVRFTPLTSSSKPGSRAYDELDQHSFVANLQKRTHGRNGVFGSTTRRFHTLKKDPIPGAGSYNPVSSGEQDDRDEGPSSSFASGVQRFTKSAPTRVSNKVGKQKDAVPPPWQYNVKSLNEWGGAKSANPRAVETFMSTTERFPAGELGGGVRIKQVPGPGSTLPSTRPRASASSRPPPCASAPRRRAWARRGRSVYNVQATPGPGQYESNSSCPIRSSSAASTSPSDRAARASPLRAAAAAAAVVRTYALSTAPRGLGGSPQHVGGCRGVQVLTTLRRGFHAMGGRAYVRVSRIGARRGR